jgi:hypothetical protein
MKTQDIGNNETISRGMTKVNGMYLAMTYADSKWFKTEKGAARWLEARNIRPDGSRI